MVVKTKCKLSTSLLRCMILSFTVVINSLVSFNKRVYIYYTPFSLKMYSYSCLFIFLFDNNSVNYSLIAVTTPEPTVRPPSRIAKRSPSSIAIGVISSTSISTLSPGMHISLSAGSVITPVTSVVLK